MAEYLNGKLASFTAPLPDEPKKVQRVKLMEEAGEAFSAAQLYDEAKQAADMSGFFTFQLNHAETDLLDELADVIQCCVNLAAVYGLTPTELDITLDRCRMRNENRGRC